MRTDRAVTPRWMRTCASSSKRQEVTAAAVISHPSLSSSPHIMRHSPIHACSPGASDVSLAPARLQKDSKGWMYMYNKEFISSWVEKVKRGLHRTSVDLNNCKAASPRSAGYSFSGVAASWSSSCSWPLSSWRWPSKSDCKCDGTIGPTKPQRPWS